MNRMRYWVLLLALGACSQAPQEAVEQSIDIGTDETPASEPSGRILRAGIFSRVSGGTPVESPETSTGKALSKLVMTFIREADRIPIKKDTILGYQYRLSGLPDASNVQLRRVLKHPEFTLPDGTVSTGSEFMINRRVSRNEVFAYDVYALNEEYEMVEGDWTFQIYYGEKLLVEQAFTTYHAEQQASASRLND